MTSIILDTTITALKDVLDRTGQDDKFIYILIDRIEEVVHDTQSLLMIKRRRPDLDDYMSPTSEMELLKCLSRLMADLNTKPIKTDQSARKAIRKTIQKLQ